MPPSSRPPLLNFNGSTATLNNSALELLSQNGATHMAIVRQPDGTVCLCPIVYAGILDVVKLNAYPAERKEGAPRLHLRRISNALAPGKYSLVWNADQGTACLTKVSSQ